LPSFGSQSSGTDLSPLSRCVYSDPSRVARLRKERGTFRLHGELITAIPRILGVTTDEPLGVEEAAPVRAPKDRRLLPRLQAFDLLSKRAREALVRTVAAFVSKAPEEPR